MGSFRSRYLWLTRGGGCSLGPQKHHHHPLVSYCIIISAHLQRVLCYLPEIATGYHILEHCAAREQGIHYMENAACCNLTASAQMLGSKHNAGKQLLSYPKYQLKTQVLQCLGPFSRFLRQTEHGPVLVRIQRTLISFWKSAF